MAAAKLSPEERSQAEWVARCQAVTFQEFWRMASAIYRGRHSDRGKGKWVSLVGTALCFSERSQRPFARGSRRRPLKDGA